MGRIMDIAVIQQITTEMRFLYGAILEPYP